MTTAEPALYRPFAVLAFGGTVIVGAPIGIALLGALHLGSPGLSADVVWLHAGVQVFGFLGTLIVGVAHHLVPRFTGRPVAASAATPWLVALLSAALALRVAAVVAGVSALAIAGALAHTSAFAVFTAWVWRALDPPPLGRLRRHLTASSAWLALACALEVGVRAAALASDRPIPDLGVMRAIHSVALFGGVVGWVTGVLLRAGPMFVPGWRVPRAVALLAPWALALAGVLGAGAALASPVLSVAMARLADVAALGTVVAIALSGGALRSTRRAPPMLGRNREEARIFRLGAVSALVAALAAAALVLGAPAALQHHVLADAVRHLLTVGFLTSVVVAMTFRLIPVLEGVALPWPGLRDVAFAALLGSVVLRTAQGLVVHGWPELAPAVALSGLLAWIAVVAAAANLVRAVTVRGRAGTGSGRASTGGRT